MIIKPLACLAAVVTFLPMLPAQNSVPAKPAEKMGSTVLPWRELMPNTPTKTGMRRQVFDVPTATLDKFHLHVSTLDPGANTGPLHRHPQEELVIIKEGTLEINIDGKKQTVGPGSAVFYSANENENMTNVGTTPATYYVIQFFTALTPKE
jgi:XRE family transcriptional regulator, regulator of sulfur utilization